jgi:hypothetical protein
MRGEMKPGLSIGAVAVVVTLALAIGSHKRVEPVAA